jgi:hypothetical protein
MIVVDERVPRKRRRLKNKKIRISNLLPVIISNLFPVIFVLELGHGHRFEALRRDGRMLVEVVQLLLAQVVDESGANRIAQDVDGRAEPAKKFIADYYKAFR